MAYNKAEAQRRWREQNREKFNAYMLEWRRKHPDRIRLLNMRHREKLKDNPGLLERYREHKRQYILRQKLGLLSIGRLLF